MTKEVVRRRRKWRRRHRHGEAQAGGASGTLGPDGSEAAPVPAEGVAEASISERKGETETTSSAT